MPVYDPDYDLPEYDSYLPATVTVAATPSYVTPSYPAKPLTANKVHAETPLPAVITPLVNHQPGATQLELEQQQALMVNMSSTWKKLNLKIRSFI